MTVAVDGAVLQEAAPALAVDHGTLTHIGPAVTVQIKGQPALILGAPVCLCAAQRNEVAGGSGLGIGGVDILQEGDGAHTGGQVFGCPVNDLVVEFGEVVDVVIFFAGDFDGSFGLGAFFGFVGGRSCLREYDVADTLFGQDSEIDDMPRGFKPRGQGMVPRQLFGSAPLGMKR